MTVTETPGGATPVPGQPPGAQMSDRMQALLSAAAEETVREQRAVSQVLGDLRGQVAALSDAVRAGATDATVERLGGVVSTVVADQRTSTALLGQRIEALTKRIDAVATDVAAPGEQAAVRLAALAAEVSSQAEAVERMRSALEQLAGFPGALSALQQDVAGLHDRLQPLTEVRSSIGDLTARTAHSLEALRPQVDGIAAKLDSLGAVPDTDRLRDAVVDALGHRLDKLEQAAERPVAGPEALKAHFGDLRAALDSQTGDRFEELQAALGAVENRLGQVGERVADVGDAAGGVPALAAEVARLHTRLDELAAVREQVTGIGKAVAALQDDSTGTALTLGLAGLRDDLHHLEEHVAHLAPPSTDEVATMVSVRVADKLVETLAPRIADVVLTRVSAALVTQLGEALSPRVKSDTEDIVRTATADSERRVLAHVDEAVLALAEALLRRRRGGKGTPDAALQALEKGLEEPAAAPVAEPVDEPVAQSSAEPAAELVAEPVAETTDDTTDEPAEAPAEEAVIEVLDRINADEPPATEEPYVEQPPAAEARPAVTTSLAPAPAPAPAPASAPAPAPVAKAAPKAEPEPEPRPEPKAAVGRPEPKPEQREPVRKLAKAPAKAPLKKAAPPVKKASRPATRPPAKPILEKTPDVPEDDVEPVRPRPRPAAARPAPPVTPPPVGGPPPAQPPAAPTPQVLPPEPTKRKPWWRPGG